MEQQSWRSNCEGEIVEEKSWRRTHVEGVVEGIWRQRHPGGTQEVFRRHPGGTQEVPSVGFPPLSRIWYSIA